MSDESRFGLMLTAYFLWPVVGIVTGFIAAVLAGVIAAGRGRDGLIWFFITALWTGVSNGVVFFFWAGAFAVRQLTPGIAVLLALLFAFCNLPLVLLLIAGPKGAPSKTGRLRRWLKASRGLRAQRSRGGRIEARRLSQGPSASKDEETDIVWRSTKE